MRSKSSNVIDLVFIARFPGGFALIFLRVIFLLEGWKLTMELITLLEGWKLIMELILYWRDVN